jgi:2,4-dienoyl-CoA reductase-like NADH-dependent reductase (Old Yellow Enzyme family)
MVYKPAKQLLMARPIGIHSKSAPNRVVYHPMECNDADEEGNPTDLTLERYRKFAEGGPGVIFVEGTKVTKESHGRLRDLGAERHNTVGLRKIVDTIREVDPDILILFQISHDGRRSGAFSRVVSVYPADDPAIHVLTTEELVAVEDMFAESAWVVEQAGADGIDLKTCNGYLGSEVLRPANNRNDGYGGSFENRTRFFRETMDKIRARVGSDFILGARISREVIPGGVGSSGAGSCEEDLAEFVEFARLMEREGMHYVSVHVSNAAYFAEKWVQMPTDKNPEDVFVHFRLTRMIKEAVGIPVMGAGYSYLGRGKNGLPGDNPEEKCFTYWAEKNLQEGAADLVGVGRQSLADPHFARKILEGREDEIALCQTCQGCFRLVTYQKRSGCVVYDKRYRESYRSLQRSIGREKDGRGCASRR